MVKIQKLKKMVEKHLKAPESIIQDRYHIFIFQIVVLVLEKIVFFMEMYQY